jgi:hypothetical protein
MKVKVWDNGGRTFDRYTVFLGSDAYVVGPTGNHPQGVCMYVGDAASVDPEGEPVAIADLPPAVQDAIAHWRRMEPDGSEREWTR